ncbi:hypothetical protein AOLI_G00137790 [Acnodon oligacanthus]
MSQSPAAGGNFPTGLTEGLPTHIETRGLGCGKGPQTEELETTKTAVTDGDPKASLQEASAATAPAEPEAEPRAAVGQCSTESDQASAKTKDYPSAVLDLQKPKAQLEIEKTVFFS